MAKTTTEEELSKVEIGPKTLEMIRDLQDRVNDPNDSRSPAQISMDIVEQILSASSLEEATGSTVDIPFEVPLTINLRAWQPSDLGVFGVFAVLECVDGFDLENTRIITCGGANVIPFVYRAEKEGKLPFKGMFLKKKTKQDFTVYWLDILPE